VAQKPNRKAKRGFSPPFPKIKGCGYRAKPKSKKGFFKFKPPLPKNGRLWLKIQIVKQKGVSSPLPKYRRLWHKLQTVKRNGFFPLKLSISKNRRLWLKCQTAKQKGFPPFFPKLEGCGSRAKQ